MGLVFCAVAAVADAQITIVPDTSRSIHVTGRGSVTVVPDAATVDLGVFAIDNDPKRAKAVVDTAIGRIVSLAKSLGVGTDSLRTAAVNIEPRYDAENPTRFRGYEVTRSITAMLRDLDKLDALLDGAVAAGANRNFDVTVTSSREAELKRQAMSLAIDNAKAQADLAARQLGVRVGPVRSINLNRTGIGEAVTVSSSMIVAATSARFLPGTIKVDAEVSVTFAIEDIAK